MKHIRSHIHFPIHTFGRRVLATAVLATLLPALNLAFAAAAAPVAAGTTAAMQVQKRSVSAVERYEITRQVTTRFGQAEPADMQVNAAGPFRFATGPGFMYIDRTDVGSLGFENPQYGVSAKALDAAALERAPLLERVDATLQRAGLAAEGRVFDAFHDEFDGAAQPDALQPGFDPRKASRHVARTAVYKRVEGGVPVFGSELMVGLMPDGSVGRFRMHWPALDAALVTEAQALQQALQAQRWAMPMQAQAEGVQVLEVSAGIAHTGFAEPGFAARAVVRVLMRKTSGEGKLALRSTGYRYFDMQGNEVALGGVPATAGTSPDMKGKAMR